MTFFVILNKKSHVASKKSYCFDFALNRRGRSSTGVPLKHSAEHADAQGLILLQPYKDSFSVSALAAAM
jgi:hypothetical protein